jgi:hypothetical protein
VLKVVLFTQASPLTVILAEGAGLIVVVIEFDVILFELLTPYLAAVAFKF